MTWILIFFFIVKSHHCTEHTTCCLTFENWRVQAADIKLKFNIFHPTAPAR